MNLCILLAFSIYLGITAFISVIILFIQFGYRYIIKSTKKRNESIKYDEDRDLKVPFSDEHRIPRLMFGTFILFLVSVYLLYDQVRIFKNNNSNEDLIQNIIAASITLTVWLYMLTLTFISKKYQLPNQRGFVINIHLCIVYSVGFIISIYDTWILVTIQSNMTWLSALPTVFRLLFSGDLVYTTITASRGPPFIDIEGRSVNAFNVASIWAVLTFGWVAPLVKFAYKKKNLTDDDLPVLSLHYRCYYLFHHFGKYRHSKLVYRIYRANRFGFIMQIILTIIMALLHYAPAYFINKILNLIQNVNTVEKDNHFIENSIPLVIGLGASSLAYITVMNQNFYISSSTLLVRVKSMLCSEIYRKTLCRAVTNTDFENDKKEQSKKEDSKNNKNKEDFGHNSGAVINLMGTDLSRITQFFLLGIYLISAPIELIVGIFFLYNLIGLSCFFGLAVIIITLPANHFNTKLYSKSQTRLMEARDTRVNFMNEVLQGIRQVKFFAWENKWKERIMEVRKLELKHLRTIYLYQIGLNFLWQGAPILVTVVSFCAFTKMEGKELTPSIAFTVIAIFNELKNTFSMLPDTFVQLSQTLVSIRRIEKYLNENEINSSQSINTSDHVTIGFKNATVGYKLNNANTDIPSAQSSSLSLFDSNVNTLVMSNINEGKNDADGFVLKDLNLEFPNGDLSIICGKTGSGKSLMMLSLLGEAFVLKGRVFCPRSNIADSVSEDYKLIEEYIAEENWILNHAVAYVAQTAWLQNASIRDNILFGLPYNEKRYKDTLYVCSLIKDLSIFEDGDQTEIGEKGITLSGGQKARVSLARAVYSRAKIIFMDDVLSAVDAHTAQHIYENCLMGPLMKHRTRILITHHVKLCISGASYLVHIQDGYAHIAGSIDDLKNNGKLDTILEEDDTEQRMDDSNSEKKDKDEEEEIIEFDKNKDISNKINYNYKGDNDDNDDNDGAYKDGIDEKKSPKILVEKEKRETGSVKLRLYCIYLKMIGNPLYWIIAITILIGSRGIDVAQSWWIKQWSQSYNTDSKNSSSIADVNSKEDKLNYYLGIFVVIAASNIFISVARFGVIYFGGLRASKIMYNKLLDRVLHAPLRFFDTTPVGRVLNRFSSDFETIDSTLPNELLQLIIQSTVLISGIIAVSSALPSFLIPMLIIVIVNTFVAIMFSTSSRELRRMESISRSPIFTHYTETVIGISTIRAFGATHRFLQEMMKRVDTNSRPSYFVWCANRWFGARYGYSGAFINVITCIIIILNIDNMDASLAGFCLSYVLMQGYQMLLLIRRYANVEMNFNAVERVVEYMEIDQEADDITEYRPPPQWPIHGAIQVSNLQIRYADHLPSVLHDLSFTVKPQEKIGIVGTTGSGKSTLALSFFRFIEASKGSIVIDNVDISRIGTEDLRSNLTIIPQDPVLFSGTLRSNLDPFDEFTDERIFNTLKRVQLIPSNNIEKKNHKNENVNINENAFKELNSIVLEGGKNFSNGQRQLICLARALLKRSKVVIMDEATASVDFDTDKLIQKHITTEFSDSTILTIAHRLATVIDYDRIMVLHHGNLLELDSPMNLLNNPDSAFYKMCEKSGEFESLYATASEKK
ncbi:unnamed protein product [Cunninghamella blakesleeana]